MGTQASNHELINYIDDNAFLRHLLAHMERNIQDIFTEIAYSFAHLPAVCKLMSMAHTSPCGGEVRRYKYCAILCYYLGLK
jgi:hypothetical protein